MTSQVNNNNYPQLKSQKSNAVSRCMKLASKGNDFLIEIEMQKEIMHHTHKIPIDKEDLSLWLACGELEAVHISLYIKYVFLCKNICILISYLFISSFTEINLFSNV